MNRGLISAVSEFRPNVPCLALMVVILAGLLACTVVRSEQAVTGIYELDAGSQRIALEILPNATFVETIHLVNGRTETRVGTWKWASSRISFDRLWIPASFAPDYIREADSRADNGQPRYTDPGNWSVRAESHWGTVVLPIFPDADIGFRMVRHQTQP